MTINTLLGIEKFGLASLSNLEIFEKEEETAAPPAESAHKAFKINEYTYEKDYGCPICETQFKSRVMRADCMRPVDTDYDLRPVYQEPIHPIYYDVIICPNCGCAGINQTFSKLNSLQAKLVLENISPKFKFARYPMQLNADLALERFKLALVNAIVKRAPDSEKAYLCMKIVWLYRIKGDRQNESAFIEYAYKGFASALENEHFPLLGMERNTVMYVAAAYAKTLGLYAESLKMLGELFLAPKISTRLKDRAWELKQEINRETKIK